jgi:hypothetical protein
MTETAIESILDVNAGIVWEVPDKKGPSTVEDRMKNTSSSREVVNGALDWLGQENKISIEMQRMGKRQESKGLLFTANGNDLGIMGNQT